MVVITRVPKVKVARWLAAVIVATSVTVILTATPALAATLDVSWASGPDGKRGPGDAITFTGDGYNPLSPVSMTVNYTAGSDGWHEPVPLDDTDCATDALGFLTGCNWDIPPFTAVPAVTYTFTVTTTSAAGTLDVMADDTSQPAPTTTYSVSPTVGGPGTSVTIKGCGWQVLGATVPLNIFMGATFVDKITPNADSAEPPGGCMQAGQFSDVVVAPNLEFGPNPVTLNRDAAGTDPVEQGDTKIFTNDTKLTATDPPTKVKEPVVTTTVSIPVTLSRTVSSTVTTTFETRDGSATDETDYRAVSGTLTFDPGVMTRTVKVVVTGDAIPEPDENFFVTLTSTSTNTGFARREAKVTITEKTCPTPDDSWWGYSRLFRGGVYVASGDVDGDGCDEVIVGLGSGRPNQVKIFDGSGHVLRSFSPYASAFEGGARIAAGDVDGDGKDEVITGAGPGATPHVAVFDIIPGTFAPVVKARFHAYGSSFGGGVYVAAGRMNSDTKEDVITGAGEGGGPHVRVFSGAALPSVTGLASFFAYAPGFRGGVRVAAGNVNGTGAEELVTAAGPGGGPHIRVFKDVTTTRTPIAGFYAFDPDFTGGLYVATGDFAAPGHPRDGKADLLVGLGPGDFPDVLLFLADDFLPTGKPTDFFFLDPPPYGAFGGSVRVAAGDVNGDSADDIITGPGPPGRPVIRVFSE